MYVEYGIERYVALIRATQAIEAWAWIPVECGQDEERRANQGQ